MLNDPKDSLGLAKRQCVVNGRGKVKQYGRRGKDTDAENLARISLPRRIDNEKRRPDQYGE